MSKTIDLDPVRAAAGMHTQLRAFIRISDQYLSVAAAVVLTNAGIAVIDVDDESAFLITDDARNKSSRTILIADDDIATSQAAIQSLMEGRLSGIASRSDPQQLAAVLKAASHGLAVAPFEALDSARRTAPLGERQMQILELVQNGLSNKAMSERLSLSASTIKREVAMLVQYFNCSNRDELEFYSKRPRAHA